MKTKQKSAAVLTINSPGLMTDKRRREIAEWLRMHAQMLKREGTKYTNGRFTGRYMDER